MPDTHKDKPKSLWESLLARPPMLQFALCAHSSPKTVLAASKLATNKLLITPIKLSAPVSYKGYLSYFEGDGFEIVFIKPMQPISVTLLSTDFEYLSISPAKENSPGVITPLVPGETISLSQQTIEGALLFGIQRGLLEEQSIGQLLACNSNIDHYFQCCFKHLFKDLHIAESHDASIVALQSFKQRLIDVLKNQYCHCPAICGTYPINAHETPASLESAIQFIHDRPGWEFSPKRLAKQANTSERNIYYQFKRYARTSPYQFHLRNRLFKAREHIISESGYDETIAYHAVNSGFFHLSRFSSLYKKIFGELPSDTKSKRSNLVWFEPVESQVDSEEVSEIPGR